MDEIDTGSKPFRNDALAIRVAREAQHAAEREAIAARRRPSWAFVGALVTVALTGLAVLLFVVLARACSAS